MKALITGICASIGTVLLAQPTLQFSASSWYVSESDQAVTLTVQRNGDSAPAVSVDYATADGTASCGLRYAACSGTLHFAAGETNKAIAVPILNTGQVEGAQRFTVSLSNPCAEAALGSITTTMVSILENDVGAQFVFSACVVAEDAGTVTLAVVRGDDGELPVSVDIATSDVTALSGRDYTGLTNTLSFGTTERLKLVSIPVINNGLTDGNRAFRATLSNPHDLSLGKQVTATVTIRDNDTGFAFEASSYTVAEDAGVALVRVLRGADAAQTATTVEYAASDQSAASGVDYLLPNGVLSFAPGETSKLLPVPILNDGLKEPRKAFLVVLTNAGAGTSIARASASVAILDNDPGLGFERARYTNTWYDAGPVRLIVLRGNDGVLGRVTVDYATRDATAKAGVNYQATSGQLVFEPNETVKTVSVPLMGPRSAGDLSTFFVELSNPSDGVTVGAAKTLVDIASSVFTVRPQPANSLAIHREAGVNVLTWDGLGELQRADTVTGPWQSLSVILPTPLPSPYPFQSPIASGFYRLMGGCPVIVHVPSGYDGQTPIPLVINLHGYTGSGAAAESYMKLQPLAESHGFLYCCPDGTLDSTGTRWWNAYFGDPGQAAAYNAPWVDDVGYLRALILEVEKQFAVDRKRVFMIGHSNGGFMVHEMARGSSDLIAAIASLAGSGWLPGFGPSPSEPVNVLEIHGTGDDTVLYSDYTLSNGNTPMFPGAKHTIQIWAGFNGASNCLTDATATLDLDAGLGNPDTTITRYTDHPPGGAVELWTIQGGGHVPSLSSQFAPAVINWLLAHPKP